MLLSFTLLAKKLGTRACSNRAACASPALFTLALAIPSGAQAECPTLPEPTQLNRHGWKQQDQSRFIELQWNFNDEPSWHQIPSEPIEFVKTYRERIQSKLGFDTIDLIQRQMDLLEQSRWNLQRWRDLKQGNVGKIKPMSCLEQRLWEWHHQIFPYDQTPSEFGAAVFRKANRLIILFHTRENVRLQFSSSVMDQKNDLSEGSWEYLFFLHNHPLGFDQLPDPSENADIGGTPVPSRPDQNSFLYFKERFNLQEARITNGLDTASYTQEDFRKMKHWSSP